MSKFKLIQIQTTSSCNARCKFCPYKDSWFINNPGKMSDKLFDKIIRNIKKLDKEFDGTICPYLMNEPFTDKKLLNKIETIYNNFPNALVEVSTNAELLDEQKIDKLIELMKPPHRGKIVISHHGVGKKSFEENMKINYEKSTINALMLIERAYNKIPVAI